jgi:metal-responsive CopG/Arc/MetJ family transcriptional regulator
MKRTQLYLDEHLWNALHARARRDKTTISELVRQAARERYVGGREQRGQAMRAILGIWKDRPEFADSVEYVRTLRRDDRLERLERLDRPEKP